ncbi:MAG: HNH endonuclease [Pelagibaca sp.]|nr:HNH endonuclease [Pelagibaca sp.]
MGRLKGLGPRLASVRGRVRALPKVAEAFYQSKEWRDLVRRIKAERGNWCERCGSKHRVIGDHKVERKDGGAELDPANIELLCQACHNRKTALARAKRVGGG